MVVRGNVVVERTAKMQNTQSFSLLRKKFAKPLYIVLGEDFFWRFSSQSRIIFYEHLTLHKTICTLQE
jgi:hypothetical protein